jgi:hypothetical protein
MSRTIVTPRDISNAQRPHSTFHLGEDIATPPARPDDYTDRLLKLVPAEVVALWVTVSGIIASASKVPAWLPWIVFALMLVLTPFYLRRVAKVTKLRQVALSTIAFVVWIFSLGVVPFGDLSWYMPLYGAILLPIYTFAVPIVNVD